MRKSLIVIIVVFAILANITLLLAKEATVGTTARGYTVTYGYGKFEGTPVKGDLYSDVFILKQNSVISAVQITTGKDTYYYSDGKSPDMGQTYCLPPNLGPGFWIEEEGGAVYDFPAGTEVRKVVDLVLPPGKYYVYPYLMPGSSRSDIYCCFRTQGTAGPDAPRL